jgi:hypothetical protein
MERENNKDKLIVLDQNTENFMKKIEQAIANGSAVILQNVEEEIDPTVINLNYYNDWIMNYKFILFIF